MKSRTVRKNLIRIAVAISVVILGGSAGKILAGIVPEEKMMSLWYPFCEYAGRKEIKSLAEGIGDSSLFWYLGLYEYLEEYPVCKIQNEDAEMANWFRLQEGREEETIPESVSVNTMVPGEQARAEDKDALKKAMDLENQAQREKLVQKETEDSRSPEAEKREKVWKSGEEQMAFYQSLKDFDTLKKEFYQIDKSTGVTPEQLDAQKMLAQDMKIKTDPSVPQILIYHTHSQEAFADSRPGEPADTVVGAGERLAELLRGYGFNVLHHTGQYDVENRDYAYSKAAPALEKLLEENPSIEVVIDLHRDGVAEHTRLVTEIDGVKTAQFMFFNGLSHTNATGDIEYLKNPYIQDNLALSFQLQLAAREYYPGLARRIYLKGYRYNMQYRPKSILLELGAQTNTVEEIQNALPPIAFILNEVLAPEE